MKKILCIVIALFFIGCEYETDDNFDGFHYDNYDFYSISYQRLGNSTRVLFMGDSTIRLGASWAWLPYTVYNVAKDGITTRGVINRLHFIDSLNPDYVVVGIGNCDSFYLSIGEFSSHIETIQDFCDARGVPVIFIEIPALTPSINILKFRIDEKVRVDNYLEFNMMEVETYDGVHYNELGYKRLSSEIETMIGSL